MMALGSATPRGVNFASLTRRFRHFKLNFAISGWDFGSNKFLAHDTLQAEV
jgi:hypothetical protein